MSLYNMMFGTNPLADVLLASLGLTRGDVGRFRDCHLSQTDNEIFINIFTRNGGGNREDYEEVTESLQAHALFVDDFDDDFDCTYATYRFNVPVEIKELVEELVKVAPESLPEDFGSRFNAALEAIRSKT